MRKNILYILVIAFLSSGLLWAEDRLTKKSVESMLNSLTRAIQARDAEKVVSFMAPDAKIVLAVSGRKLTVSPEQYRGLLDQAWAQGSEYSYKVTDQRVKVASDGKSARVTDTTHETVVADGQKLQQSMRENVVVELRDGKPKITSLSASES